jgi:hypothetical protein
MTGTVLPSRPGPDVDLRLVRHEGRTVANKDQIPAVCRVHVGHARQVPDDHLDWGVRGMRAVNQRRLLCAFAQEHQNVVVGMDPSQTPVSQSMTEVTR